MTDQNQRIQQAEQAIKLMTIMQYLMPLVLLGMALAIPMIVDLGENKMLITLFLCAVALGDYFLLRFLVIPKMQNNLNDLKNAR